MIDPVAVRRKSDGAYLQDAKGDSGNWSEKPRFVVSKAKAEMIIRVDLGRDLTEFQIIPRDQVMGFKAA